MVHQFREALAAQQAEAAIALSTEQQFARGRRIVHPYCGRWLRRKKEQGLRNASWLGALRATGTGYGRRSSSFP
jgi:hypothetical protein